jgi:hypothetical protein
MLGEPVVALRGGAAEMVEGQAEALGNLGLNAVHFGAVFGHRLARLGRRQFGRGAVLIVAQMNITSLPMARLNRANRSAGSWLPTRLPRCLMPLI